VISDAVVRAGFAPVLLNPVNFEAIFQAQREAKAQARAGAGATH
jgi:preprotein translocase subunit SecB